MVQITPATGGLYCGIFDQSKNCGARETAVVSSETTLVSRQRPRNKREKQPLLGDHQRANGLAE
jgi:hypothetical protein